MDPGLTPVFGKSKLITVGGGKGGVGKSTVSAGLACALAALKKKVILVDADLGGANLHLFMGVRYPDKTLKDFISGELPTLSEVLIPTAVEGVSLISGAAGIYELSNPRALQKHRLLSGLKSLEADYVIIDIGAGSHETNTDFFALSETGIVVLTNEPTSVENAYSFLKNSVFQKISRALSAKPKLMETVRAFASPKKGGTGHLSHLLDRLTAEDPEALDLARSAYRSFRPRVVVNMVRQPSDVGVEEGFKKISKKYLNLELLFLGYIVYDPAVEKSVKKIAPLTAAGPSEAFSCLQKIAKNMMTLEAN